MAAQLEDKFCYPIIQWLKNKIFPEDNTLAKQILTSQHLYAVDQELADTLVRLSDLSDERPTVRRVVPSRFKTLILSRYHDSLVAGGHMGKTKTYKTIVTKYY